MCEKKPGPRCSLDALKTLVAANKKVEELTPIFEASAHNFKTLNLHMSDFDSIDLAGEAYFYTSSKMNTARRAKDEAEVNYNSTKEGLASLDRAISVTGDALESTVIEVEAVTPGVPSDNIVILTSKKKRLGVIRALASSQRDWQRSTLKSLTEAENDSLDKALFIGSSILDKASKKETELSNMRRKVSHTRWNLVKNQIATSDYRNKDSIVNLTDQVNSLTQQVNIFNTRKSDMEAYVNDIKKKIAERNIA